jgi:hypothetical protein
MNVAPQSCMCRKILNFKINKRQNCNNQDCRFIIETDAIGVTSTRWLTMATLDQLDEIGTRYDVPRFSPSQWK